MFTFILKTRLTKEPISYMIDRDMQWFTDSLPSMIAWVNYHIGQIDFDVDYDRNPDRSLNSITMNFKDTDKLLNAENNHDLLAYYDKLLTPYLYEADRKHSQQVYLFVNRDTKQKRREIYDRIITDHRINDEIGYSYVFHHNESNTSMIYHSTRPLRFDLFAIAYMDGPYYQIYHPTEVQAEPVDRMTSITYLEVKDQQALFQLYDLYKAEIERQEEVLTPPQADQDDPTVKEEFLAVNQLYRYKENDAHALRLIEHSIIHYDLPYFVIKNDANDPEDLQYFYIDNTKERINKFAELKEIYPGMTIQKIHQHATDLKKDVEGYGVILPKRDLGAEEYEPMLAKVLICLTDNIVSK